MAERGLGQVTAIPPKGQRIRKFVGHPPDLGRLLAEFKAAYRRELGGNWPTLLACDPVPRVYFAGGVSGSAVYAFHASPLITKRSASSTYRRTPLANPTRA